MNINNLPIYYSRDSKSTVEEYAKEILEVNPELGAIAVWNPEVDGSHLIGSAPGIPVNCQEVLAQLCLGNIFRPSAVIVRQSILEELPELTGNNYGLDEHQLWFLLARKNRLGLLVTPPTQCFGNNNEGRPRSSTRMEFIRNYCLEDAGALGTIERALSLCPDDVRLSTFYFTLVQDLDGQTRLDENWESAQYLRSMQPGSKKTAALNELSEYFKKTEKPLLSALTCLFSLAHKPDQTSIYNEFKKFWLAKKLEPNKIKLNPINYTMVSVLLCTYNRPERLVQALESVLSQTYADFEVLVINDGGDRAAEDVVDQFDSAKVRYFYQEHGGHRTALNLGLQMAQGKYIAYLDDDDVYYPNHLETLVNAAETGSLDFVCSLSKWIQGHWDGNEWAEDYELNHRDNGFQIERMRISAYVPDNTILHRRSIVENVGLFWEEPQRGGEWEYWVRCSRYYPIHRIETITCECRVLTASLPLSHPARARFFTDLWRVYFGSEFGNAIIALGAYCDGDQDVWELAIENLVQQYVYLQPEINEQLWKILVQKDSPNSRNLLIRMAQQDTVTFSQNMLKHHHLFVDNVSRMPLKTYLIIIKYIVFHPSYILKRFSQLRIN